MDMEKTPISTSTIQENTSVKYDSEGLAEIGFKNLSISSKNYEFLINDIKSYKIELKKYNDKVNPTIRSHEITEGIKESSPLIQDYISQLEGIIASNQDNIPETRRENGRMQNRGIEFDIYQKYKEYPTLANWKIRAIKDPFGPKSPLEDYNKRIEEMNNFLVILENRYPGLIQKITEHGGLEIHSSHSYLNEESSMTLVPPGTGINPWNRIEICLGKKSKMYLIDGHIGSSAGATVEVDLDNWEKSLMDKDLHEELVLLTKERVATGIRVDFGISNPGEPTTITRKL